MAGALEARRKQRRSDAGGVAGSSGAGAAAATARQGHVEVESHIQGRSRPNPFFFLGVASALSAAAPVAH